MEQASTIAIILYPFIDRTQLAPFFINRISLLLAPYYKENSTDHFIQYDQITLVRDEEAFNRAMDTVVFIISYVFLIHRLNCGFVFIHTQVGWEDRLHRVFNAISPDHPLPYSKRKQ